MSRSLGAPGEGFFTSSGIPVLVERSHALPLVDVEVALGTGSVADPIGKEGLSRMTARLARAGTGRLSMLDVEERVAELGGRLGAQVSFDTTRFQGSVIRRNLRPFLELLASLIISPSLRSRDLGHLRRETISDLVALMDHDRSLAARRFRQVLFGDHPYGRPIAGTRASLRRLRRQDLVEFHAKYYRTRNVVIGLAGDIEPEDAREEIEASFGGLPKGRVPKVEVPAPRPPKGRRVAIVHKPERTQAQLYVGGLGSKIGDPLTFPLEVGNTAFGGMFTGRLMHEVRSRRGLSYGASSRIHQERQRDAFAVHTFPSIEDAVECTALIVEMIEEWAAKGLRREEVAAAKRYLVNGHCFDIDTADKRLDSRMDVEVLGVPAEFHTDYERLVRAVKPKDVQEAIRRRISPRDLLITLVADEARVRPGLEALPGITSVDVIPHDRV